MKKLKVKSKNKKDLYYKCKKCGSEIYWNTRKNMTYCKCGAIAIDGCLDYIRLIGNEKDFQKIFKKSVK